MSAIPVSRCTPLNILHSYDRIFSSLCHIAVIWSLTLFNIQYLSNLKNDFQTLRGDFLKCCIYIYIHHHSSAMLKYISVLILGRSWRVVIVNLEHGGNSRQPLNVGERTYLSLNNNAYLMVCPTPKLYQITHQHNIKCMNKMSEKWLQKTIL